MRQRCSGTERIFFAAKVSAYHDFEARRERRRTWNRSCRLVDDPGLRAQPWRELPGAELMQDDEARSELERAFRVEVAMDVAVEIGACQHDGKWALRTGFSVAEDRSVAAARMQRHHEIGIDAGPFPLDADA